MSENSQDSHERLVSAARFRNVADAACVPLSLEVNLQQHASAYGTSLILVRTADRHLGDKKDVEGLRMGFWKVRWLHCERARIWLWLWTLLELMVVPVATRVSDE